MYLKAVSLTLLFVSIVQEPTLVPRYIPPPPEQPLPFSHKDHLALSLECQICHVMPEPGHFATLPDSATCMACHDQILTESPAIHQLADFHKREEAVPWIRVYRIPDYVFFSHQEHVKRANIACEVCHGPVREMEQMQKVKDISMAACIDCHRQKEASIDCDFCHDPL